MYLLPNCIDDLKYSDFWKNTEEPSLNKFLSFRLHQNNLEESEVEHRRYKDELKSISNYYDEESEIGKKVLIWKQKFKASINLFVDLTLCHRQLPLLVAYWQGKGCLLVVGKRDKNSAEVKLFWELQVKKQDILKEIRLLEERCKLLEKEQTEMENKMCLEQTQHILHATRETVDQGLSLQRSIVEKLKKRVLDEPYASCEPPKRRSKVTNSDIIAESHSESNAETDITEDSDIIAGSHSESNAKTNITEDSEIIAGSHSESNEETDTEVINITEDNAEIESLTQNERDIRKKLLEVLNTIQDKERKSKEDHMSSVYLNNILDLSDLETRRRVENSLNEDQHAWLNTILKKQTSDQTEAFKQYVGQFNERVCNRKQIPTLVRKSFILDRFDSYYYEDYDIAHQILEHCATRLEAHISYESKSFNLERTFAIDTVIYILNRLFKFHQDVLDSGWIELTTPHTKKHKFDGLFKVIRTNLKNQVIIVVEFSSGRKASLTKEHNDHVKLCRNAMRTLNAVLQTIPREKARIYLVQFVNSYLKIEYMIRPLPSVYLLNCFMCTKVPETFDDFEKFSKDMAELINWQADVLFTTKEINKIPYIAGNNNVCTTPLEDTPKKDKKVIKKANDSYPGSPCPGSPSSPLI
ncbi:9296_t:CDS:10 [Dentiscutata erythropus]|uniref:9296_t:CDS:1 n=1 Tax=Dentiscutata erythropus TaxID=1348616 RepID=A0A9N9CZ47_9GLOM|nr:9296_t:CDS:10 [Dentiscutata erythropus]